MVVNMGNTVGEGGGKIFSGDIRVEAKVTPFLHGRRRFKSRIDISVRFSRRLVDQFMSRPKKSRLIVQFAGLGFNFTRPVLSMKSRTARTPSGRLWDLRGIAFEKTASGRSKSGSRENPGSVNVDPTSCGAV